MTNLAELPKQFLIPGSLPFLLLGLIAGLVLLHLGDKAQRWGRRWLTALAAVYLLLSLPATASLLERALTGDYGPVQSVRDIQDVEAIVILGGGSATFRSAGQEISELSDATALRILEGARLYRQLQGPKVIASGGADLRSGALSPETDPMIQELVEAGVPSDHVIADPHSGSTREQALNLASLLRSQDVSGYILVTSPIHMRRAIASFRAEGLQPVPSTSAQHGDGHPVLGGGLLPHPEALSASHLALRELYALTYYWARGWLSPA